LPLRYSEILKQSPIFSTLDTAELADLSRSVSERQLAAGEYLFWEGDPADWFYIITKGKVKVSKISSQGKETILDFFGPGEMVGEVAVFAGKAYPASAQAQSDASLLGIQKSALLDFLSRYPEVTLRIINILSGRLRDSQNRLRDLAGERVEQRLARILMMLSARLGKTLPFTRQELADMAGTTTETAIRILSQWKARGIVASSRGKTVITNDLKLRLLAEGPPRV
jgi:CRP-like cAMP-binding protein